MKRSSTIIIPILTISTAPVEPQVVLYPNTEQPSVPGSRRFFFIPAPAGRADI